METTLRQLTLCSVLIAPDLYAESITKTFPVAGDTWVHSNNNKVDNNFDGQTELHIKGSTKVPYLKFSLLGVTGCKLPLKRDISKVEIFV